MKVLLIEHPRGKSALHFNDIANTPLSSCLHSGYIASLLHVNDIETDILDSYLAGHSFSQMLEEIIKKESDMIGIHLVYSWEQTPQVLNMISEIKNQMGLPIIVYGFYPTFAYEFILKNYPAVDCVIIGEPELTFLELAALSKKGRDTDKAYGIAFRNGKEIVVNKRRKIIEDLDMLPFPFRNKDYLEYNGGNILGGRGCYGNCTFCYINNYYGKKCYWRGRTPHNIYHEVQAVVESKKEKYIYFIDANFFGPGEPGQKRAEKTAELLKEEGGLRFGLECRVNDIQEKSLRELSRAGLQDVFLGVESASNRSLRRMRKGTTIEQAEKAIALLRRYDIEPYCGFIMFEPDSSLKDIRDNFNFLKKNSLINKLITSLDLLYHPQIVLMGTDSYRMLKERDRMEYSTANPYQGTFVFRDKKVAFLAEVISSICRHLLNLMDTNNSPLYWDNSHSDRKCYSQEINNDLNQWLVEFFDEILAKLELNEINCGDYAKAKYLNDSIDLINRFIVCFETPVLCTGSQKET